MAKQKISTPEERHASNLESMISWPYGLTPEPTYFFEIGESIVFGMHENCHITWHSEDYKIYEVTYEKSKGHEFGKQYAWWYHVRPFPTIQSTIVENKDIWFNTINADIMGLLSKVYVFGCEMNPPYQRGYVWNRKEKEKLISSIFQNIDIGKFSFIKNPSYSDKSYEILDGKQRLSAILEFYENNLSWNGLYFNDLSLRDRSHFENYHVSISETEGLDIFQQARYFIMLNTSGRSMTQEDIERACNVMIEGK